MRYAPHATPEFNTRFEVALRALTDDVRRTIGAPLTALVLGGGYGRGEGAVIFRNGLEQPYNDLDLLLVMKHRGAVEEARLRPLRERQQKALGVEIDFGRPLTVADIERWPCSLMWQDLLADHIVLHGPPNIITAHAPAHLADPLPCVEGTRLLLNRGAGLLWSMRIARRLEPTPDVDFIRRNFYKCALALGDALLIAHGRFTPRCDGRDERLATLLAEQPLAPCVLSLHRSALRFKLKPDDLPARRPSDDELEALARDWTEVFLYVEQVRAGRTYRDRQACAADRSHREPGLNRPSRWMRNAVQNLREGRLSLSYPREHLYRALPPLLTTRQDPSWDRESARFLRTWRRYS
ncbi:MAG: hypothetical protein EB084_02415 [Proteobacteria bacterium]|nr:hypothetical protein [Pseudomonadota bacterium]